MSIFTNNDKMRKIKKNSVTLTWKANKTYYSSMNENLYLRLICLINKSMHAVLVKPWL